LAATGAELDDLRLAVVASAGAPAVGAAALALAGLAELVVVAVALAVTMPPVRPAMAATLSQPASRRALRAGCGRFRRGVEVGIGHSWVWCRSQVRPSE
jgi:hypothetical protein